MHVLVAANNVAPSVVLVASCAAATTIADVGFAQQVQPIAVFDAPAKTIALTPNLLGRYAAHAS